MTTDNRNTAVAAGVAVTALALSRARPLRGRLPRAALYSTAAVSAAVAGNEATGRRVPFLRWSFIRMMAGFKTLTTEWQVGDGREDALLEYVLSNAQRGDLNDVIRVIDEFCYRKSFMMNVGDEKGELLDAAVARATPKLVLEVGTYVGYSALRIARQLGPDGRVVSVEFSAANADIARRVWDHAGIGDRITVVVGTLGDGGQTADALTDLHGFGLGSVGLVFLDHDKECYLPDLELILDRGWLRPGAIVVADNVKFPGAPKYHAYMNDQEGLRWRTTAHDTHAEYQSVIKDVVLESEYLGR